MTQAARFTGLPGQKLGFQVAPGAWRRSGRKPGCRRRELSMQAAITSVSKPEVLNRLCQGEDISAKEAEEFLTQVLDDPNDAQMAAFLVLLRAKGESREEVEGLATAMRSKMTPVKTSHSVLDIVGTGGDGIGSFNISTGSSILAAAAGAKVAKHGSRSASSLCGSADVLEELGVAFDLGPNGVSSCIDSCGIGFMFAPRYHPAMKAIKLTRTALKIRTVFNILGPMLNPAQAPYSLIGVANKDMLPLMANSFLDLGAQKALVVHSMGLDELTPMGPADVMEVSDGQVKTYTLQPGDVGIPSCEVDDIKGGDKVYNAQILRDLFGGAQGPMADTLCLNAGYALAACGLAESPIEGVAMARDVQVSGKAGDVLAKWIEVSQKEKASETPDQ